MRREKVEKEPTDAAMAVVKEEKDEDAEGGVDRKSGISILALFLVCCCVYDDNHDCAILKEAKDVVVSMDAGEGEKVRLAKEKPGRRRRRKRRLPSFV